MCYLHLLCRQWSYLRLWLSRKAGTGAAPASGPVFSGPATRRTLLGDNCCSQLKIVSTPARTTNPGTLTVTRSRVTNPRVSWQHPCSCRIQTPAGEVWRHWLQSPVPGTPRLRLSERSQLPHRSRSWTERRRAGNETSRNYSVFTIFGDRRPRLGLSLCWKCLLAYS